MIEVDEGPINEYRVSFRVMATESQLEDVLDDILNRRDVGVHGVVNIDIIRDSYTLRYMPLPQAHP